jgi:hypothetical protein
MALDTVTATALDTVTATALDTVTATALDTVTAMALDRHSGLQPSTARPPALAKTTALRRSQKPLRLSAARLQPAPRADSRRSAGGGLTNPGCEMQRRTSSSYRDARRWHWTMLVGLRKNCANGRADRWRPPKF